MGKKSICGRNDRFLAVRMCGIAGILRTDSAIEQHDIQRMTDAIAHRGPDGEGFFLHQNAAIGHRRLAIIDLATGTQPMCNEDQSIWVTFNGEIYNYLELRRELQAKGHIFTTHSDTETIVHAYEEWHDRCVERLRGMFAFGIMDLRQRRFFLARDHLGIKPLYYFADRHLFAFASELQAFHGISGITLNIDLQAVDQYLWLSYIPAPKSVFTQIAKLLPAHRMSVDFDGTIHAPEEYWHLVFRPDENRSEAEWLEALDDVLRESVRAHLVSDVPFGVFLSGGVDSSAITAYMSQILEQPVQAFSIGFEEEGFSEIPYAKEVAERLGIEHHIEIVQPKALEILPQLVAHYGEPFGDSSAIPTFYVAQMARKTVPMVLSGDGGDEAFAGYHRYRGWLEWLTSDEQRPGWKRRLRSIASVGLPRRYPRLLPTVENWIPYIANMNLPLRKSLWLREYRKFVTLTPPPLFQEARNQMRGNASPCSIAQYLDIKTYLPSDILIKVDVASMCHGLEVRTPFVDLRVFEFAATIPESFNIARNNQRHWEGKLLLKKLMQQYYSPEFLHRHKRGFEVPLTTWLATDGAAHQRIQEQLLGRDSALLKYFEPAVIKQLLNRNISSSLWLLLFLDEWLRQNTAYRTTG